MDLLNALSGVVSLGEVALFIGLLKFAWSLKQTKREDTAARIADAEERAEARGRLLSEIETMQREIGHLKRRDDSFAALEKTIASTATQIGNLITRLDKIERRLESNA